MISRRTFALLSSSLALSACAAPYLGPGYTAPGYNGAPGAATATPGAAGAQGAASGRAVAALLPLTGRFAGVAGALENAVHLALDAPGAPQLTVLDTGGTAAGAAAAARQAVAAGAGLIVGPLTAAETAAAAPVATAGGAYMLAFTNDPAEARAGVWTLGITPGEQVAALAAAAQAAGRTRIAALLPDDAFGHLLASGLQRAAGAAGAPSPTIRFTTGTFSDINVSIREMSQYQARRGPIDAEIKAAQARGGVAGRRLAHQLARQPIPPAPFDALLLGQIDPAQLAEIATFLPYYDVSAPGVQVMGPAAWGAEVAALAAHPPLRGGWYPAPDPTARTAFVAAYQAKFGQAPPMIADLAYDAAAIARVLGAQGGFTLAGLTSAQGFTGADGVFGLLPGGQVVRALAVYALAPGGGRLVRPAATSLSAVGA